MNRPHRVLLTILVLALVVIGGLAAWQYRRAEHAERQLGIDASRILSAVFTQARELRVARLTGVALAKSSNDGVVFHTAQETRAPFSASYFVDLRQIGPGDYSWDAEQRRMTVRIPDVTVEAPAIDMAAAQVRLQGMWVSRKAAIALNAQASQRLAQTAAARARSDENRAKARAAAVVAVTAFVRQPLAAAGYDDVTVVVRFPWEGSPSSERWDRSRRPEEVLANSR